MNARGWRRRRIVSAAVAAGVALAGLPGTQAAHAAPEGPGFALTVPDLQFILQQIKIAEAHATREGNNLGQVVAPTSLIGNGANDIPDPRLPWGLRQVDGRNNNLVSGRSVWSGRQYSATSGNSAWGASDQPFLRLTPAFWRDADEPDPWVLDLGPAASNYSPAPPFRPSNVQDAEPRLVSNLIADQSNVNDAAVAAAGPGPTVDADGSLLVLNTAPNAGVAAPYNGMFVLFGQFFDHGLDLVGKTGAEKVIVPLSPDDPLYNPSSPTNFMVASRTVLDANADGSNSTTPWIDQNQTYTSHPSHQVFLREYVLSNNRPVSTGNLFDGLTAGNIANWSEVKQQALVMLGIRLVDTDIFDVPLLLTDEYGRFLRGPNGFPQLVQSNGTVVEGNPSAPISTENAARTGHAFLDDIAHTAAPSGNKAPDNDSITGNRPASGFYDDELLARHFITGDGRGNENIGLTAIHTVFHAEHNRLVGQIKSVVDANAGAFANNDWKLAGGAWNGERLFQAARFVNEMEYQHLVFEEFARSVQPAIRAFAAYDPTLRPDITAEFAHAVYRFGHSQLNAMVDRVNADGSRNDKQLLDAFLNPVEFNNGGSAGALNGYQAAGSIARGMTYQVANEIDEFVTNTLRNTLLGLPLDLATLNIVRARDTGMGSLNQVRRSLYASTGNAALAPYSSWFDFGFALRHQASLVNFVAAYGTHPSITSQTTLAGRRSAAQLIVDNGAGAPADAVAFMTGSGSWSDVNVNGAAVTSTGLEDIDLWMGGLAEARTPFGGMLGSTFDYVFTRQMENLQEGDRFYYLGRLAGLNLLAEIEANSFAEIIMRNSDAEALPANVFFYPARTFMMNGPAPADITVQPDGTWRFGGAKHVVFNGTAATDRQWSSGGNDTLRGNDGNDWMQGGMGNDSMIGGLGDDIIQDSSGLDSLIGGAGNDYIASGGPGADAFLGGAGIDFLWGGTDATAMTGGVGNDLAYGGSNGDAVSGDDGSDWLEGGPGADALSGDVIPPFGIDLGSPGDDLMTGGSGNDLLDGGGLMDVSVAGLGQDVFIGGFGFDWQTYYDPNPATAQVANADLTIFAPLPGDILAGLMDGFDVVEALSGGDLNDILRGDIRTTLTVPLTTLTDNLNQSDIPKIAGLQQLLGAGVNSWTAGNILIGGRGADRLEGRSGDDLIDGDAWLEAWLSVPAASGVTGTVDTASGRILVRSMAELQSAVLAGRLALSDISVVRRINAGAHAGERDDAVFTGNIADYTISYPRPGVVRVVDNVAARDGTDTLRNVERLVFLNGTVQVPVPSAPRNVAVAPSATQLVVSWQAPQYTGGSTVASYLVSAFTSATATNAAATCTATTTLTCTLTGLTTLQTYHIEVVARVNNANGAIAFSGVPSPRLAATPGTTPTAPLSISTNVQNSSTVRVSWQLPSSSGGSSITGYDVTVWPTITGGTATTLGCWTTGVMWCDVSGVTSGVLYYAEVRARNIVGAGAANDPRVGFSTSSTPFAPRSVTAASGDSGGVLSWQAPASDGGYPITQYTARVYSTLTGTTVVTSCTVTMSSPTTPLQCPVSGLVNGRGYGVDVVATNSLGLGAPSAPRASLLPRTTTSAPGAPTLTPQIGSLAASWAAPLSNGGSTITGYTATAYTTADGSTVAASCTTTGSRSCTITGLAAATTYHVSVVARNAAGDSVASARTPGTTLAIVVPDAPTVTSTTPTAISIAVGWSAPGSNGGSPITGYTAGVFVDTSATTPLATCSTNGSSFSCTVTGLAVGTSYQVRVRATNLMGSGAWSAPTAVSTLSVTVPGSPTITSLAPNTQRIRANWSLPASNGGSPIISYTARAFLAASGGNPVGSCNANGATATNCTIRNLSTGTSYWIEVVATNAVGSSLPSARVSGVAA